MNKLKQITSLSAPTSLISLDLCLLTTSSTIGGATAAGSVRPRFSGGAESQRGGCVRPRCGDGGACIFLDLDAEAEAANRAARRDFFLDPVTAVTPPSSGVTERPNSYERWDRAIFSCSLPTPHLVSTVCLAPISDCALLYGANTKRREDILVLSKTRIEILYI